MTSTVLLAAYCLDALVGDPRWLPHPVRWIGCAITRMEQRLSTLSQSPARAKLAGMAVAISFPLISFGIVWSSIDVAGRLAPRLGHLVEILWAFSALGCRDLANHATAVLHALTDGSLPNARHAVAQIVGRDTAALSEPDVVRATVESVAESISDGIVAPLFFLSLGGAPLAWAYKTVSTLDSMIGHRELPYRDVGWASAKLDDVMNWIPARITGWLLGFAAGIRFLSPARAYAAWKVMHQDGDKHLSPNSGRPEAAMAGALQIQLGGENIYDGIRVPGARMGTMHHPLTRARIAESVALAWLTSVFAVGLAWGVRWVQ